MIFNAMPVYLSLVILIIIYFNLEKDNEFKTARYVMLRVMCFCTLLTNVITIISTITLNSYFNYPLWLVESLKVLYFIFIPSTAYVMFYYAVTLTYNKASKTRINRNWVLASLPYLAFIVFILFNYVFHQVFYISPTEGYQRGPFAQISYIPAAFYLFGIIIVYLKNKQSHNKGELRTLCVNIIVSTLITATQIFYTDILLSPFASTVGVLMIFLYIHNQNKTKDSVTKLSNRQSLMDDITKAESSLREFSVFVLSIRNFKGINDKYGLLFGDEVLETTANYLKSSLGEDMVYRYSGDEFAILIKDMSDTKERQIINIFQRFKSSFDIANEEVHLNVVYARVDYPQFSSDIKTLISTVDYAISILKSNNDIGNYLYDIKVRTEMQNRNIMEQRVKDAIQNDKIIVHYQPIYDINAKKFNHAEALLRLTDMKQNPVNIGEFVSVAEKTRLIIEITYIIIEKVCIDLKEMLENKKIGDYFEAISINFPYILFLQEDLQERILSILQKYNIPPTMIRIEITERTLVGDATAVREVIFNLQQKGFVFELDDFGVEYSNLNVLINLPFNIVKIDKSLIDNIMKTQETKDFFAHLMQSIKSLERKAIAEGIENDIQFKFLKECNCDYIQGYIFSKPLPLSELKLFLNEKINDIDTVST